jgi:hypothetical protein
MSNDSYSSMLIILLFIFTYIHFHYLFRAVNKITKRYFISAFLYIVVFCTWTLLMTVINEEKIQKIPTYKQGQIDAINGKIKYHLIKHSDGTVVWEKIKLKKI